MNGPAQEVLASIERIVAAAETISDPIARADALEAANANVAIMQSRIRAARGDAVREALRTRSAVDVAEELGVTRARVYQIAGDG